MTSCEITCEPHDDAVLRRRAALLAEQLPIPLRASISNITSALALVVTPVRLELRVLRGQLRGGHAMFADWGEVDVSPGAGGRLSQPIAKAVGRQKGKLPTVILDATGGFGQDAWLLAALGCRVTCVERHPIIAALLEDAWQHAQREPAAERLRIVHADAAAFMNELAPSEKPDVVYLDPMFPLGRKTAEHKPMRVLRMLVGDDPDAANLLEVARRVALKRVVVKRPLRAAPLSGKPHVVHKGKATRYDVYLAHTVR